jgi:polyferredoxin
MTLDIIYKVLSEIFLSILTYPLFDIYIHQHIYSGGLEMLRKLLNLIVLSRIGILVAAGLTIFYLISEYHISLWWLLLAGTVTGIIFGKVFCRWMCPIGIMMEVMMGITGNKGAALYQYHKMGCPIAWISGWLNKYSLFKITRNSESCTNCGLCDKKCYIVQIEPQNYSLFRDEKESCQNSYSCSRCLECVTACPNGSLSFKPGLLRSKKVKTESN